RISIKGVQPHGKPKTAKPLRRPRGRGHPPKNGPRLPSTQRSQKKVEKPPHKNDLPGSRRGTRSRTRKRSRTRRRSKRRLRRKRRHHPPQRVIRVEHRIQPLFLHGRVTEPGIAFLPHRLPLHRPPLATKGPEITPRKPRTRPNTLRHGLEDQRVILSAQRRRRPGRKTLQVPRQTKLFDHHRL